MKLWLAIALLCALPLLAGIPFGWVIGFVILLRIFWDDVLGVVRIIDKEL